MTNAQIPTLCIGVFCFSSFAQYPTNPVKPTSVEDRLKAVEQRKALINSSSYLGIEAQNIGPTIMSGRVVDVAVNPKNAMHFFVAYATGGIWETKNNGQSFTPIFDNNGYTIHCGALAVDWKENIIYVGTGEANSSRSSYAGYGIFKAKLNEKSYQWINMGLADCQHIAKIVIHPTDSRLLFVATMGNHFSPSKNRGLFRSIDGGITWTQNLFVGENTGAIDVEFNPKNTDEVMVAMWEKGRRAWNFWESGKGSGIYTSKDKGQTWAKSEAFLSGENVGRIGISFANDGVVYAVVDNQEKYEKEETEEEDLTGESFLKMSKDSFRNLNDSVLNKFLKDNRFPKKYDAKDLKKMVKKGDLKPKDLYDYLTDANTALFSANVIGAELYRSSDFGQTWTKSNDEALEKLSYSYGYYFGVVQANPQNSDEVFIAGVPLLKSKDAGKTFAFIGADNMHVDHHFIWVNPENAMHLINGNDGGINISFDGGEHWVKCNSPAVGQFYTVAVDNQKPYNVYGGLQDNGVWKGPNYYKYSASWLEEGKYPYERLLGGDGMQIQIDSRDNTVYTGYQFGHYMQISPSGKHLYIHPMQELKEPNLRWNWQTPILLSAHNQDILYMGSNKLHRSMNQGEDFEEISGDLTQGGKTGDVSYGTLSTISESPLKFGYIYVGSDDGLIHFTKDGGESWTKISDKLPQNYWVRKVVASQHKKERVLAILNGVTWDNFKALVYCSEDYGKTWKQIGKNLPDECVNFILEDPENEQIVYLATDAGVYISTDMGETFSAFSNLPPVAVHALAIQEKHKDLIVGTHGRSIYKIQLEPVHQSLEYADSGFIILPIEKMKYRNNWGKRQYDWGIAVPSLEVEFFAINKGELELQILTNGKVLKSKKIEAVKGYNKTKIELNFDENPNENLRKGEDGKYYPIKGKYTILVKNGNEEREREFVIE